MKLLAPQDPTAPKHQPGQGRLSHAPASHPAVSPAKIGVIIANLGTPDATDYWSMRRYLKEFLSDPRVIEPPPPRPVWWAILNLIILSKRPFTSGAAYRGIWNTEANESPLLTITKAQTAALAARLRAVYGTEVVIDFAMRYGNPSTESVIHRLVAQGCERLLFFPLYPQYASPTTATANDQAFRALMKLRRQPAFRTVPDYFAHPLYIEALAQSVERHLANRPTKPQVIVASYHGLPKRYLMSGDPYHCQCLKTTRLLRERLKWDSNRVQTAFQSRFGKEEWLKPYTVEHVVALAKAGVKDIAMLAPAFAADCVETLEEINEEIREAFLHAGGEVFTYIPCLNDDPAHIDALFAVIQNELSGWV